MAVELAELGFIAKIWWKHMFYIDVHMNVGYSTVLWGLGREWSQLVLFERSPWFENEVEEIYKIKYRLSMPDKRLIGIYSTTFTCTSFESLVLGEKFSHSVFLRFIFCSRFMTAFWCTLFYFQLTLYFHRRKIEYQLQPNILKLAWMKKIKFILIAQFRASQS